MEVPTRIWFLFLGFQLQSGDLGSIYFSSYSDLRMSFFEAGHVLFVKSPLRSTRNSLYIIDITCGLNFEELGRS